MIVSTFVVFKLCFAIVIILALLTTYDQFDDWWNGPY